MILPATACGLLFVGERSAVGVSWSVHIPSPDRGWQKRLEVESKKGDFVETRMYRTPPESHESTAKRGSLCEHRTSRKTVASSAACCLLFFHLSNPGMRLVACISDVVGGRVFEPRKVVFGGRELQFVVSFTWCLSE